MNDLGEQDWYTISDLADRFHVDRSTVQRWVSRGKIGTTRLTSTSPHRISPEQLAAFEQESERPSQESGAVA